MPFFDRQRDLVYNFSADSDITSASSAEYCGYYRAFGFNEFDGEYHTSSCHCDEYGWSSSSADSTLYTYYYHPILNFIYFSVVCFLLSLSNSFFPSNIFPLTRTCPCKRYTK